MSQRDAQSFEHYFARFPGLVEPALVALSPSLPQKPIEPKETQRSTLSVAQLEAWKDLYSHNLNEQIAALSVAEVPNWWAQDLDYSPVQDATAAQGHDDLMEGSEPVIGGTGILLTASDGMHSKLVENPARLVGQINPVDTSWHHPPPTRHTLDASLAGPRRPQCLSELPLSYVDDDAVFTNTRNVDFQNHELSACIGVDFAEVFDAEAVLLQHLHHGEMWGEAQFSAPMIVDPALWGSDIEEQTR